MWLADTSARSKSGSVRNGSSCGAAAGSSGGGAREGGKGRQHATAHAHTTHNRRNTPPQTHQLVGDLVDREQQQREEEDRHDLDDRQREQRVAVDLLKQAERQQQQPHLFGLLVVGGWLVVVVFL